MKVEKLTTEKFDKVMKNQRTKMQLALELGINLQTLEKWIKYQYDKLTKSDVLEAIHKITGLTMYDVLVKYQEGNYQHHIKE